MLKFWSREPEDDREDYYGRMQRGEKIEDLIDEILEKRKLVTDDDMAGDEISYHLVPLEKHPKNRISLRDMQVGAAIEKLRKQVNFARKNKFVKIYIITGGKNHVNPILKSAVIEFAKQHRITHYILRYSPECVVLSIQPPSWKEKIF